MSCRAPATHTPVTLAAPAADAMNKGAAAPAHKAATLPKARILLAPNTLTSCFEPPQGNAAERTLTYEEPRRSPPPRIWAFSRPSFVPHKGRDGIRTRPPVELGSTDTRSSEGGRSAGQREGGSGLAAAPLDTLTARSRLRLRYWQIA